MVWKAGVSLDNLKKNSRETAVVDGNKILFIWHEDKVHAVQAQCPHLKFPLLKGKINDRCELVCPMHKSEFDLNTGAVVCWSPWPPVVGTLLGKLSKPKKLRIYPTRIDGDQIFVELADSEEQSIN